MYKTRHIIALSVAAAFVCIGIIQCSTEAYSAVMGNDHGTFNTFYKSNLGVWAWVGISCAAIIGVAIAVYTVGSGIPAWCATVGAWIGGTLGLSGAAATNAGLALLGGGSIASGGFGMVGGVAVLTAAFTFSTEMMIGYTLERAVNTYNDAQFVNECRHMLYLPCPVNTKGGQAYAAAQKYIVQNLTSNENMSITSESNQQVLRTAITKIQEVAGKETDVMNQMKNKTMLALLFWLLGEPAQAAQNANEAIRSANQWNDEKWPHNFKATPTVAEFILAICQLELEKTDSYAEFFEYAILEEPNNKLIPLLFGIYLDRLMALYYYDKIPIDDIKNAIKIAADPKIGTHAPIVSVMLLSRLLVETKRRQQDILIIVESKEDLLRKNNAIPERLKIKFRQYGELVQLGAFNLIPLLVLNEHKIPKEITNPKDPDSLKLNAKEMKSVLEDYYADADRLRERINEFNVSVKAALIADMQNLAIKTDTSNAAQNWSLWVILKNAGITILAISGVALFLWLLSKRRQFQHKP